MGIIGNNRSDSGGLNDPIYLAQINKDKENEEEGSIQNPGSKFFALVAATLYLKKFVDHFVNVAKSLTSSINTEKVLEDIAAFKNVLCELCLEDKSHDPTFTHRLSKFWQKLYENCSGLEEKIGHLDSLAAEVMLFVKEVNHFPQGEEFTLGYYLTEHAGQDWIPFPFMNMLRDLHEEYLAAPTTSQLDRWVKKINEISGSFSRAPSDNPNSLGNL
jgi:hypothetical protein